MTRLGQATTLNLAIGLGLATTLSGCGFMPPRPMHMYEGEPRPVDELAVFSEGHWLTAWVEQVDGIYVVHPVIGGAPPRTALYVPPGEHEITLFYRKPVGGGGASGTITSAESRTTVTLVAEAGHTYVPFGIPDRTGDDPMHSFWIVDAGPDYPIECVSGVAHASMYVYDDAYRDCPRVHER